MAPKEPKTLLQRSIKLPLPRGIWLFMRFSVFLFTLLLATSCTKKQDGVTAPLTEAELIERGGKIYAMNCISCHNADPSKDGVIGPAIKGSGLELITARIMRAEYPVGYNPKRTTKQMIALPMLEKEIPAIHLFLNQK